MTGYICVVWWQFGFIIAGNDAWLNVFPHSTHFVGHVMIFLSFNLEGVPHNFVHN